MLVYFTVEKTPCMTCLGSAMSSHFEAWVMHLKNPSLRASFAIGFCILFAFIGTFTFVNFVLVQPPLGVGAMTLGFVYFVFVPAMATTPLAGRAVKRFGTRPTFWAALAVAALGLPLLILPNLPAVLIGMVLVGAGTFFAQACATGFVGRAATSDRGAASGLYLACYFFGGLIGSAVLGVIFDMFGWDGLRRRHRRGASGGGAARRLSQDADGARGRERTDRRARQTRHLIQRKDFIGAASYAAAGVERVPDGSPASAPGAPFWFANAKWGRRVAFWDLIGRSRAYEDPP